MQTLSGKTALITGVSRQNGIGFAIAERLAEMGINLFLHSYSPYDKQMEQDVAENELEQIAAALKKYNVSIEQQEADFQDAQATQNIFNNALKTFEHIDILVLNHTYDSLAKLEGLTATEIDRHLAVNVRAALQLIQLFAKNHDGRPGGRIIMLTSGQHLGPMPDLAYVASKGALLQLTSSVSDLLIDTGITVNTVNPGPVKTYKVDEKIERIVLERMPLKRWGEPDDPARLIAWLVTDEARWITGQVINSEGGFRRG